MTRRNVRNTFLLMLLSLTVTCCPVAISAESETSTETSPDAKGVEFFEKHIRPVLVNECYECHAADSKKIQGGLLLDSRLAMRKGGDTGAAAVPKDTSASLLLSAIRYDEFEMPPDGQLSPEVIKRFEEWIEMGAPDPRDAETSSASVFEKEQSRGTDDIDWLAARTFWAFQSPKYQPLPNVSDADWPLRRIDWFTLAKIDEYGLSPNSPADPRTLLRRAWIDTIGLPPPPDVVDAFVADSALANDSALDAYEQVVEGLLSSSHFGEHWARMWLDIARYAEDQAHIVGDDASLFYPNAYLYRDWVISAFNDDMPFDRFVRLQLAADFEQPDDARHRVALGFIGLGPKYYNRGRPEVKADEWEDRVDTVTRGLLGLTVACARCHDHKFDPIGTKDYYALAGVFASTQMVNHPLDESKEMKENEAKAATDAMHVIADGEITDLNVFVRGDVQAKGESVRRRFLQILNNDEADRFEIGSGRGELADAIVDPANPLTARVFVNRVWGAYFGKPLVGTPSNFGHLGDRPTHPELLDDLAVRFMESGWSIKWLHREILMSATYRQSSQIHSHDGQDPGNRWLARMSRKRMRVEQWRDTLLAVTSDCEAAIGGKSIDPQHPDERRRTVYSTISRFELNSMLSTFDFPDPNVHSARRTETTTPLQKLFVLNSPFMTQRATELVESLLGDKSIEGETAQHIKSIYRQLMGRAPSPDELAAGESFVTNGDPAMVWQQYAQVLLAANEMMFID